MVLVFVTMITLTVAISAASGGELSIATHLRLLHIDWLCSAHFQSDVTADRCYCTYK